MRRDVSGKLTYTVGVKGTAGVRIAGGERKRDTSSSGQHGVLEEKKRSRSSAGVLGKWMCLC